MLFKLLLGYFLWLWVWFYHVDLFDLIKEIHLKGYSWCMIILSWAFCFQFYCCFCSFSDKPESFEQLLKDFSQKYRDSFLFMNSTSSKFLQEKTQNTQSSWTILQLLNFIRNCLRFLPGNMNLSGKVIS